MLRITIDDGTQSGRTVRLEGRLVGPWVGELESLCLELLADGRAAPALDLGDVLFVDGEGLRLLSELSARGVHLSRCPPLVAEQLGHVDRVPGHDAARSNRGGRP